ncbi:hypothetical protein [Streptomyces sp. NPDC029004]|uniref:hypothetical protein n=1 Tax=Streptomyces sp. NPDC029004 TaxID=3154490 RepID=UPI0033CD9033
MPAQTRIELQELLRLSKRPLGGQRLTVDELAGFFSSRAAKSFMYWMWAEISCGVHWSMGTSSPAHRC